MSGEVVVPVDRVVLLSAILANNHSFEVVGEEPVIGPQVESEVPVHVRRKKCSDF